MEKRRETREGEEGNKDETEEIRHRNIDKGDEAIKGKGKGKQKEWSEREREKETKG